jgi:hypothetical protein
MFEHSGDAVGHEDVLDERAADVDPHPLEPALARVALRPEHAVDIGVPELEGQAEGGEVQQVLGVATARSE